MRHATNSCHRLDLLTLSPRLLTPRAVVNFQVMKFLGVIPKILYGLLHTYGRLPPFLAIFEELLYKLKGFFCFSTGLISLR